MSWLSHAIGSDKKKLAKQRAGAAIAADQTTPKNRFLAAMPGAQGTAERARQRYEGQAAFDPGAAFNTFATGAWSGAQAGFKENLRDLKGAAAGSGRLDTGFYDDDVGELARSTMDDFGRTIAGASLNVAGMQQNQNQFLGGQAMESENRYLDMLSGERDRQDAIEEAKANRKQQGKSALWGAVGGGLGSFLGRKL